MESKHDFTERLIHKYELYVAPFTFLLGFILDTFTLRRIDLWLDHFILLGYLLVSGAGILLFNAYEAGRLRFKHLDTAIPFVPVAIQFGFGGLFSAFVIFYVKSAAFAKSWIFLLALVLLLVGNERFRKHYQRLIFQVSIYFTVLFSYAIFALPLIVKKIGDWVFLLSGLASLVLAGLFIVLLQKVAPRQTRERKHLLLAYIGGIYLLFNFLYFANIIPPIPLALKESGVYHLVTPKNGMYEVVYEKPPWYLFLNSTSSTFHWRQGEFVYSYSAIFVPASINTLIFHRWYYYDEAQKAWTDRGAIQFPITGGRDEGYRGYSYKTDIKPGKWRVDITNSRGQILGRQTFTVVEAAEPPLLERATR
ncbi:MAG: DUF2914 domain-containing protein [Candidatus Sungbacteria bacterium]|nr:DUF2914 domain-containing protein [Candidatus Sungbacteria bacterium]